MLEELAPFVVVIIAGEPRLFELDTGAGRPLFTASYCRTLALQLTGRAPESTGVGGAGGSTLLPAYRVGRVQLRIGAETTHLDSVTVLAAPLGTDRDDFFGLLGQDVTKYFGSFSLDFHAMRFTLHHKEARR